MQIPSVNSGGIPLDVSDFVFGRDFNEALVHQLVVAYMSAGRVGTKAQKTRSEVSGGGAKPWKQKGSGRARAGTTRGPLWRSGGVTFAARPRCYAQKLNKKMYRAGMRSILSELLRQGRLFVTEDIVLSEPKTKQFLEKLKAIKMSNGVLVTESIDNNLLLASRNVMDISVCLVQAISPVMLVDSERVVITSGAAKKLEAVLS